MTSGLSPESTRRDLLARAGTLLAAAGVVEVLSGVSSEVVEAKDYVSRREALDALDGFASVCGMRLGTVGRERASSTLLVTRFLAALRRHRATRDDARRRFALPKGVDPSATLGAVDADLGALRQALDDLMVAYAECLPALADSGTVSRFALDMVEVSKMRTVVDLWVTGDAA